MKPSNGGKGLVQESDTREMVRMLGAAAGSADSLEGKRRFLMTGLGRLIDADAWILIVLGRREAGEMTTFSIIMKGGFSEQRYANFLKANEHPDMKEINRSFMEELEEKKTHITRLREQADKDGLFLQSDAYALWKEADLTPMIVSFWPTSATQRSGVIFFRRCDQKLFSERDSRIAHIMLSEVPWLHSGVWPERSDSGIHNITPRLNTVLNLLLQGIARKSIASQLDISVHTINGYARDLYRRFDVHSQAELIRRFVDGDGGDCP